MIVMDLSGLAKFKLVTDSCLERFLAESLMLQDVTDSFLAMGSKTQFEPLT